MARFSFSVVIPALQAYARDSDTVIFAGSNSLFGTGTPYLANNVLVIGRDVTKQKHVEENLRASEARYRSVVEDQTGLIARWKPDGTLTYVNKAVSNIIGL